MAYSLAPMKSLMQVLLLPYTNTLFAGYCYFYHDRLHRQWVAPQQRRGSNMTGAHFWRRECKSEWRAWRIGPQPQRRHKKSDPRRVGRGIQELIFHVNANLQSEEQVSDATVQAWTLLCAVAGKMGICPSQRPKGCPHYNNIMTTTTLQHKPISCHLFEPTSITFLLQ
jgi:hypothetical protein